RAISTEGFRDRSNDAHGTEHLVGGWVDDIEPFGRCRTAVVFMRTQRIGLRYLIADFSGRHHICSLPSVVSVQRHLFDKAKFITVLQRPSQQLGSFMIINAPEQYRVDFDGV